MTEAGGGLIIIPNVLFWQTISRMKQASQTYLPIVSVTNSQGKFRFTLWIMVRFRTGSSFRKKENEKSKRRAQARESYSASVLWVRDLPNLRRLQPLHATTPRDAMGQVVDLQALCSLFLSSTPVLPCVSQDIGALILLASALKSRENWVSTPLHSVMTSDSGHSLSTVRSNLEVGVEKRRSSSVLNLAASVSYERTVKVVRSFCTAPV